MCVWSMIIDHHDNKTQNQEFFFNSMEVRKARSNYKVCECECEYAADIIDFTLRSGAGSDGDVSM